METQLLRKQEILPTDEVLENALGNIYPVFELFRSTIIDDFGLTFEWHYYNDGKSWLGKISHKKKTILWLSIWENWFQASFYFTEKYLESIAELDIDEDIIAEFSSSKMVGKLIPMIFRINSEKQLDDLFKVIEFKKKLK